jgi:hypothetical protein
MKKLKIIMLMGMVCFTYICALAQKKVPHGFQYQADASEEGILKEVTHVAYPGTSSIRLYFEEVQLGSNSYLLLEGNDGSQQKLDAEALKNWRNSSAYFNGGTVKVSVYQAPGDSVTFKIEDLRVDESQTSLAAKRTTQSGKTTTQATSSARIGEFNQEEMPYAAAVGRFTNGSNSFGTGWIAPNGAIVTSKTIMYNIAEGYDIIEFNVPLSNNDGSVNHPSPEDQYPIIAARPTYEYIGASALFNFENSIGYEATNEPGLGISEYRADWAIVEPLPSTGLRPGERQQQYFRVATNPGAFTIEAIETLEADILHYGSYLEDIAFPENSRTLRVSTTKLLSPKEYIEDPWSYPHDLDSESMIIYQDQSDIPFSSSMGAPITYHESNVAIGVHHTFYHYAPAGAIGFKDSYLRNELNDFFTSNVVYVDVDGLYLDNPTGEVHKPYIQIADGIGQAADDAIVYIAKGSYNESVTINTPMTLKAPVGVVKIGTSEGGEFNARKATLPPELFMEPEADDLSNSAEETNNSFDLKSYPNPFTSSTEINYELSKSASVHVNVYDKLGNKVRSLVQESQVSGVHSVVWDGNHQNGRQATPGLYVIRIETALKSTAVKVIKN